MACDEKPVSQNSPARSIDIAFLFASPITLPKEIGSTQKPSPPIDWKSEIKQIIKFANQSNYEVKLLREVAEQENLIKNLLKGVSILHIACHGRKTDKESTKDKRLR